MQAISTTSNNGENTTFVPWSFTRSADKMRFEIYDKQQDGAKSLTVLSVTRKFKLQLWYHLTFTLSPLSSDTKSVLRLYINGQLTDQSVAARKSDSKLHKPLKSLTSSAIYLGSPAKSGIRDGSAIATSYDNIAMWHRALDADEVQTNYEKILGE